MSRLRSAVELASDVDGLRLVLGSVRGDRYRVRVANDGAVVGLWRRQGDSLPQGSVASAAPSLGLTFPSIRTQARRHTYAEQGPGGTSVVVDYLAGPDDKVDLYGSVSQPTSFPFLLAAPGNGDDHFIDVEIFVP